MLRCPKCNKGIHQKYALWSQQSPRFSQRVYECKKCRTRFIEIVEVGSCQVVDVIEKSLREGCTLDEWM